MTKKQDYEQTLYDLYYAAKEGLLGAGGKDCTYHNEDRTKFCAVGYLLNNDEHKELDEKGLNNVGVGCIPYSMLKRLTEKNWL